MSYLAQLGSEFVHTASTIHSVADPAAKRVIRWAWLVAGSLGLFGTFTDLSGTVLVQWNAANASMLVVSIANFAAFTLMAGILIASFLIAVHSVPKLIVIGIGRQGDDHPGHYSVLVKNTSMFKTVKNPVLKLKESKPRILNCPIPLHGQPNEFSTFANPNPSLAPINPGEIIQFDVIKVDERTGQWSLLPQSETSGKRDIPQQQYEVTLEATGEDTALMTANLIIHNDDGKPRFEM